MTADVLTTLDAAGIPSGKVRSIDEVYSWEQTASQGLLIDVEHPVLGPVTLPGPPLRFFDGDGTEHTGRDHSAPPMLGQHNETVRRWLDESSGPATADGRADRSHDPEPQ
jgi:crotonobetainyl-CoA:carnitine CoA-transferase CaiB-like acyl-CoA transferase